MERTNFAGLTALVPGDALESDGGSFLNRNPKIIDHFLEVGAVTHRHDGHPALANPSAAVALAVGSGGTIGNDVTLWVGYTVVDAYGGETALSPLASANTGASMAGASAAPAVAFQSTGGTLAVGTYYYAVTLLDGSGGETLLSDYGQATRPPGYASGQMLVSGLAALMAAAGATAWRLYRSYNGGGWAYMTQGSTDTFLDDGVVCADSTLLPPDTNSTGGTSSVVATVPALASGSTVRLYASQPGDFASPAFVTTFTSPGTASAVTIRSTDFAVGSPPPVSTSKPGANKINALTDIDNLGSAVASLGYSSGGAGGSAWQPITLASAITAGSFPAFQPYAGARRLSARRMVDGEVRLVGAAEVLASGSPPWSVKPNNVIGVLPDPAMYPPSAANIGGRLLDWDGVAYTWRPVTFNIGTDGRIIVNNNQSFVGSANLSGHGTTAILDGCRFDL